MINREYQEDYEYEDDEQELEDDTARIDIDTFNNKLALSKLFNFDMLATVKPSITRIKPPDFDSLVFVKVHPGREPQYVDKAYYRKDDPSINVVLPHKWQYYYCGCRFYNDPMPSEENNYYLNPCCVNPIQKDEQVYTITIFLNRKYGRTSSQRWRIGCWHALQPQLQESWLKYRNNKTQEEAEEYFRLHSVINEQGERIPEPSKKPGRPVSLAVQELSVEDKDRRTTLTRRYGSYQGRRRLLIQESKDTTAVEKLLTNIYDQIDQLGGVPNGWVRYNTD